MKIRYDAEESDYTCKPRKFKSPKGDKFKLTIEKGKRPYHLERKPPLKDIKFPRYLSTKAMEFIFNFLPEFEIIWNAIKASEVPVIGTSIDGRNKAVIDSRKEAVLSSFDHNHDWECLDRRTLETRRPYTNWRERHEKEDFRGKLLYEFFDVRFPREEEYAQEVASTLSENGKSEELEVVKIRYRHFKARKLKEIAKNIEKEKKKEKEEKAKSLI